MQLIWELRPKCRKMHVHRSGSGRVFAVFKSQITVSTWTAKPFPTPMHRLEQNFQGLPEEGRGVPGANELGLNDQVSGLAGDWRQVDF